MYREYIIKIAIASCEIFCLSSTCELDNEWLAKYPSKSIIIY